MAEKKATTATKATKKAVVTKKTTTPKKATTKKAEVIVNAENVGFRAGDVYQALAAAEKPLSIAEIAKVAKIQLEEVYLGIGWLFKEGKIKDSDNLFTLA